MQQTLMSIQKFCYTFENIVDCWSLKTLGLSLQLKIFLTADFAAVALEDALIKSAVCILSFLVVYIISSNAVIF